MKSKRLTALLLACLMCLSMLSACGDKATTAPRNGGSDPDSSLGKTNVSIAIWEVASGLTSPETDAIYKTISDKFNVEFTAVNTTWDDADQKIQAWAASDQLPDWFAIAAYGKPFYDTWVQEGIVKDLTDEIPKYPNIAALMEIEDMSVYNTDGRYYCIPRPNYVHGEYYPSENAMYLRKDLMEAAGWSVDHQPETLDEFIQMIQDMMKIGNCDVGITAYNSDHMRLLSSPYCVSMATGPDKYVWEDGQWKPIILSDMARDAVVGMGKMYEAGIIDKDIPTLAQDEGKNKFCSGQAVGYCYNGYPAAITSTSATWDLAQPDKDFTEYVTLWRPWYEGDTRYYKYNASPWSESYFRGDISQEKLDAMLSVMDYLLSDEGLEMMRLGIKDVDYTKDADGNITVLLPEGEKLGDKYPFVKDDGGTVEIATWDQEFQFSNPTYDKDILALATEQLEWWWANGKGDNTAYIDARVSFFEPSFMQDYADLIGGIGDKFMTAYIAGGRAGEVWDENVAGWNASGFGERAKEFSDKMIAAGISK